GQRWRRSPIRHMQHVGAGHHFEQLAGHMGDRTVARRSKTDLARMGLGVGYELWNRLGRNRRIHLHDLRHAVDARDRRDIADKVVVQLFVERGVDHIIRADGEQRVAIWWRTHDGLSSDIAASARPVLNDELLTKPLGEPLTYYARDDVN